MKNILLIMIIICAIFNYAANAQQNTFFFDIFVTKDVENDSSNVDLFCCVPNQILKFTKQGSTYAADFTMNITFTEIESNKTSSFEIKNKPQANTFEEAQGIKGDYVLVTKSLKLSIGNYRVRALLRDNLSGKEITITRSFSVINYNAFDFSISSILLLSGIEEVSGDYIITPYLYDNVSFLNEGYFAFFEVYNDKEHNKINITTEVRNNDNDKVIYNTAITKEIDTGTTQLFVKIPAGLKYGIGNNTLKITATEGIISAAGEESDVKILAVASRSIRSISTLNDRILKDLDNSIRQLKYVATDRQIDTIRKGETDADKLRLFEAFWKRLDPTPHTEKNEAQEEYYKRIDYANENFKAYREGWLSDKGQVYIVFGPPLNIERTNHSLSDNRTFERWTYRNNRIIVFVDVSGFGDFRLYSPNIITDKFLFEF